MANPTALLHARVAEFLSEAVRLNLHPTLTPGTSIQSGKVEYVFASANSTRAAAATFTKDQPDSVCLYGSDEWTPEWNPNDATVVDLLASPYRKAAEKIRDHVAVNSRAV